MVELIVSDILHSIQHIKTALKGLLDLDFTPRPYLPLLENRDEQAQPAGQSLRAQ